MDGKVSAGRRKCFRTGNTRETRVLPWERQAGRPHCVGVACAPETRRVGDRRSVEPSGRAGGLMRKYVEIRGTKIVPVPGILAYFRVFPRNGFSKIYSRLAASGPAVLALPV
jgi:hypothetical protein